MKIYKTFSQLIVVCFVLTFCSSLISNMWLLSAAQNQQEKPCTCFLHKEFGNILYNTKEDINKQIIFERDGDVSSASFKARYLYNGLLNGLIEVVFQHKKDKLLGHSTSNEVYADEDECIESEESVETLLWLTIKQQGKEFNKLVKKNEKKRKLNDQIKIKMTRALVELLGCKQVAEQLLFYFESALKFSL